MGKTSKPPTKIVRTTERRIELDPSKRYYAGVWHKFDFQVPFEDAVVIPVAGGAINQVDYKRADEGKLRVKFRDNYASLRAIRLFGCKP